MQNSNSLPSVCPEDNNVPNNFSKLKIPYPIIVEGRYDRAAILEVADALVITTEGFGVFKNSEKNALLRVISNKSPVIILTDSDGAGNIIRSHIKNIIPKDRILQVYIPKIKGKEKRKNKPSAEGTIGVEGMDRELLYDLLKPYEDPNKHFEAYNNPISKTDFFNDGLSGAKNSTEKRDKLAAKFSLPSGMTANSLLAALKLVCSYDEYKIAMNEINVAYNK